MTNERCQITRTLTDGRKWKCGGSFDESGRCTEVTYTKDGRRMPCPGIAATTTAAR